MRPSNNLENKAPSDKSSASMYESSGSQLFRSTTRIKSGADALDEKSLFWPLSPSWELQKYYAVSD